MLRRLLALTSILVGAAVVAGSAGAADATKPLRIIVYDVTYSSSTVRHEHTSGFTGYATGGSTTGSGLVDRRFSNDDAGTLTVAIVAATPDGGLVADCSFVGKQQSQTTVRVAILKDGSMSYDPKLALSPPAAGLLPFLARGLIAERNVSVDSAWSVPAQAPASGETTYKVVATDGVRATLDIVSAIVVKGRSPFTESTSGRTIYATDLLSPISLDLHSTLRRDVSPEMSDTIDSYLTAKLRSDVFPKAGR